MKALVLGGTGAMGAPLVSILVDKGLETNVATRQNMLSNKNNLHF